MFTDIIVNIRFDLLNVIRHYSYNEIKIVVILVIVKKIEERISLKIHVYIFIGVLL